MNSKESLPTKKNTFSKKIKNNWPLIAIGIAVFSFLFSIMVNIFFDSDIYHMLTAGREIARNGILREDVFFIVPGHKIVIQQWLYNLIVYEIFANFGKIGILVTVLLFTVCFALLLNKLLKYYNLDYRIRFIIVILACVASRPMLTIRPELLTICLLLIQLILCEEYRKTNNKKVFFFLPLLTLLEINLHATLWIAHFVFLLPYIVPLPTFISNKVKIENNHIRIKDLLLPILLMLISLFINPYGLDGITILFKQGEISKLNISELASPNLNNEISIVMILLLIVVALCYGRRKIHTSNLFLFLGTSLMLVSNLRNKYMFIVGATLILADVLCDVKIDIIEQQILKVKRVFVFLIFLLVSAFSASLLINVPYSVRFAEQPIDCYVTPTEAVNYLNTHADKDVILFTDFNNGSYVAWNDYKIYFSSRTEGYCMNVNGGYDLISEYVSFFRNYDSNCNETFDAFLNKYDFDYLIVDTRNRMFPYLIQNDSYKTVVTGNEYAMFETVK
ncbi:MAG: hypothetical protein MJ153_01205 [Clostridia bacterium]|nr:hypothetical protein [Clostridia bacterium]